MKCRSNLFGHRRPEKGDKMSKTKWYAKPIYLLVALALVLSLGIVALPMATQVSAQPAEVWVDDNFTSATPSWGTTHFDKIQDGVNAVALGGTVHVAAGTYNEQVLVDKSVSIKALNKKEDATVVDAVATTYGRPFMVIAAYVTIDGFTIYAGHQWCCNTGIPIIIGAVFPGDERYLGDAHHVTVRNNFMKDSWTGVYVYKSSYNLIVNNKIVNPYWDAVQIYDGSTNSEILIGYDSQYNKIINNEIIGQRKGGIFVGAWNVDYWPDEVYAERTDNTGTKVHGNYMHDPGAEIWSGSISGLGTAFSVGSKMFSGNKIGDGIAPTWAFYASGYKYPGKSNH